MIKRVKLGDHGYDIVIERGALCRAGELFDLRRRVLIVTDDGVPSQYSDAIEEACRAPYRFVLEQGEASKNIDNLTGMLCMMTKNGFGRGDCVVAVGGGVCGDIAGFAAAVYMRGIDFYNVPTTVLSQVDSSVGGKTAIDLLGVKNVVGAFKQPAKVLIDPDTLSTLPMRHVNNGLCEALKMAATSDPELFGLFEHGDVYGDLELITERSLDVKIAVVEADEREAGPRRVLNFGHTIGHGIESATSPALLHGECVALGMLPMCSPEMRRRLAAIYGRLGLPASFCFDKAAAADAMTHDKKGGDGGIYAVFVEEPGKYEIRKTEITELIRRMEDVL